MKNSLTLSRVLIPAFALMCLWPGVSGGVALILGVAIAVSFGNPYSEQVKPQISRLLSYCVIGLGAGMNLFTVAQVGLHGIGYTLVSISSVFVIGLFLGRWLKTERVISTLITLGTAICGGSAIAAAGPVLRAKPHEMSVALGVVFLLNALALLVFPTLGHFFGLSEGQFGLWCALAIHDTSSVVGATLQYGPHALEVGTTVKLARALYIVPIVFILGFRQKSTQEVTQETNAKVQTKKPWFIAGFLAMAALVSFFPALREPGHWVEWLAKRGLVLTLFLIGANLNRTALKLVGFRPLVQAVLLWAIVASGTLLAILQGAI